MLNTKTLDPYTGEPDIERLIAAFRKEPVDRVPNFEVLYEDSHVTTPPQIVAFSGLLTTTLANMPEHIKALENAGVRDKVKLAVGELQ